MQRHRGRARHLAAGILALVAGHAALGTIPASGSIRQADGAAVPIVHVEGRGHGHGVGLSQWGAFTLANDGADAATILAEFYPGTEIGTRTGEVAVVVDSASTVRISLPSGGEIRSSRSGEQSEGFPIQVAAGGVVEVSHDGQAYVVSEQPVRSAASSGQRFAAQEDCLLICPDPDPDPAPDPGPSPEPCVLCPPTTTTPPDGGGGDGSTTTTAPAVRGTRSTTPVWAIPSDGGLVRSEGRDRTYRGLFEVVAGEGVRVRNHVDVEDYLKGMAEVPSAWPAAAIQAQTVAARTYALRAVAARGELCDSEACQVYVGVSRETPSQRAAVDATAGQVVTYEGALAATFYSASAGGFTANVAEGFGSDHDVPYLTAHPYPTDHPDPWEIDIALSDVADRLDYDGTLTSVRITSIGPSKRATGMELVGSAGRVDVDPQTFRRRLGLRSTLFEVETTTSETAPAPPPSPLEGDQLDDESVGTSGPAILLDLSRDDVEREPDRVSEAAGLPISDESTEGPWPAVAWTAAGLAGAAVLTRARALRRARAAGGAAGAGGELLLAADDIGAPDLVDEADSPPLDSGTERTSWIRRLRRR